MNLDKLRSNIPEGLTEAEAFFYQNAGFSFGQGETQQDGLLRCSKELAKAEAWAQRTSVIFQWDDDDEPAEAYDEETKSYAQYDAVYCIAKLRGRVIASLSGIIESENRQERENYRRVVEAELADEGRDHIPAIIKECEAEAEAFKELLNL